MRFLTWREFGWFWFGGIVAAVGSNATWLALT